MSITYGENAARFELVPNWTQVPGGQLGDVCSIAIDENDCLYVLTRGPRPVMVLRPDGSLLDSWGQDHFGRAHGSCLGKDGALFCTDDLEHTVTKFSVDGRTLMTLGTKGVGSDTGYRHAGDVFERISSIARGGAPFNRPTGVGVNSGGDIFVADGYGNARVHRFTPDGSLVKSWGQPGSGPGEFRLPHLLAIDSRNRVYVADRENSRVQVFDAEGTYLDEWRDVIRPTGICFDADGLAYVSEFCNRISLFRSDGTLVTRWGNQQHDASDPLFVAPHTVAVDSQGSLYVGEVALTYAKVDRGLRNIQKFARTG